MRQILLIISCLFCSNLFAQELTVKQMTALPMDLSASQYERKDLNGQPCALVKVQLATMGARFEGNVVGSADYKTNEYWVYMTEGSYLLSVKHSSFVPLSVNFRDYGISVHLWIIYHSDTAWTNAHPEDRLWHFGMGGEPDLLASGNGIHYPALVER